MTERVGIIDLGSNSARLIIMNIYHNRSYNLVYNQKEGIRLSEGMSRHNRLQETAISRALQTMKLFRKMCTLFNVDKIIAVATAAVRNAENGADFLKLIQDETHIPLQVISGPEEAALGFLGVANTLDISDMVLFDLGGGSTELTLVRDRQIKECLSLPFGAVTLTEKFQTHDKITPEKLQNLTQFIYKNLSNIPWLPDLKLPLVGIGGTMRNLAKIDQRLRNYPFSKVHNYRVGAMSFQELWRILTGKTVEQRRRMQGLSKERADIIVAGATLIKELLASTQGTNLIVSGCGVREGAFFRHYFSSNNQHTISSDILLDSAVNIMRFFKGHEDHIRHVAQCSLYLFDRLSDLHTLGARERKLLHVAALLHDTGITVSYYDHPRHSAYLVENSRIFGLTHHEQMLCAVIVGWHNGPSAKMTRNRLYNAFLEERDWSIARKLALLLGLAEALDASELQLIPKIKLSVKDEKCLLQLLTRQDISLETRELERFKKWFYREFQSDLLIKKHKA